MTSLEVDEPQGADLTRRELLALASFAAVTGGSFAAASSAASPVRASAAPGEAGMARVEVDRAFVRLDEGLIHFRHAGAPSRELPGRRARPGARSAAADRSGRPPPLYLAHAGPGSSRAFEPFIAAFGRDRHVIAPDMPGNGDSAPPLRTETTIGYYVDETLRFADSQGLERFDFLGAHTGAQIGCELAVRHPDRVRRLVVDGVPLFPPDLQARLLQNYAPTIAPDDYGRHLIWAWNFVRDQSLYFPWFDRTAATRLANEIAPAERLHDSVTDVIKAIRTYHIAYRAAFAHDTRAFLPQLRCPVLVTCAERDPLHVWLDEAAALVPGAQKRLFARSETLADRIAAVRAFLA